MSLPDKKKKLNFLILAGYLHLLKFSSTSIISLGIDFENKIVLVK
jgi:hypothetical protein